MIKSAPELQDPLQNWCHNLHLIYFLRFKVGCCISRGISLIIYFIIIIISISILGKSGILKRNMMFWHQVWSGDVLIPNARMTLLDIIFRFNIPDLPEIESNIVIKRKKFMRLRLRLRPSRNVPFSLNLFFTSFLNSESRIYLRLAPIVKITKKNISGLETKPSKKCPFNQAALFIIRFELRIPDYFEINLHLNNFIGLLGVPFRS